MKTRHGFVSNSSSSSFCIYGTSVRKSEWYNLAKAISEKLGVDPSEFDDDMFETMKYMISEKTSYTLSFKRVYDWDNVYIGRYFSEMPLESTRKDFQDSIQNSIRELFPGMDFQFSLYQEVYYS